MTYIEKSLSNGETIYKIFSHHWMIKVVIFINFLIGVLTVGIWLLPAIYIWLSWKFIMF